MELKGLLGTLSSLGSGEPISLFGGKLQIQSALKPTITEESTAPAGKTETQKQAEIKSNGKITGLIIPIAVVVLIIIVIAIFSAKGE